MSIIKFFIDFDGTVTKNDVVDMILSRFASSEWKEIEEEWVQGRIGSRECLLRQMSLVKTNKRAFESLLSEVQVDPFFLSFLKTADRLAVPVAIVSDGFDLVIRSVLRNNLMISETLLEKLPIYSNKLLWQGEKLNVVFSNEKVCEHGCGNCKPKIIGRSVKKSDYVVFVGDGHSDRFAAEVASLTFAKNELLEICWEKKINHRVYLDFSQIESWLLEEVPVRTPSRFTVPQATGF